MSHNLIYVVTATLIRKDRCNIIEIGENVYTLNPDVKD